jgi:O-antigen/teichoic acid export membrane protein
LPILDRLIAPEGRVRQYADADTARAAGMAAAVIAGNVLALAFTVVFARLLGGSGYGSLAALISTFIILMVPGSALQTTVAREVSGAVAHGDPQAGAGVRRWLRRLAVLTVAVTAVSILGRDVLATIIGVDEEPWGAAATLPTGCIWLMLSVERGALQGFQSYRLVGGSWIVQEAGRLAFGAVLYAAGLGVTGAFLGTAVALGATALALGVPLRRRLPPGAPSAAQGHRLRQLAMRAWAPVLALALVAWLQDGHVIIVKHVASDDDAGAWAAAAVAAKAIIWVALGLGLYLVPEAARRARAGEDARGVLIRTLGLIGMLASAMVLVYAVGAEPLLRAVFDLTGAAGALPWLGLAMSLLAVSYLAVQYMLALHHAAFIALLGLAAVAQPTLLLAIGDDLTPLSLGLFAVQGALAMVLLGLALRTVYVKAGAAWAGLELEEPDAASAKPAVTTGA